MSLGGSGEGVEYHKEVEKKVMKQPNKLGHSDMLSKSGGRVSAGCRRRGMGGDSMELLSEGHPSLGIVAGEVAHGVNAQSVHRSA